MLLTLLTAASAAYTEEGKTSLPAFPGAEGYGAIATGGRGGKVIHVTNLNSKGPGSLQWACSQIGPRIVVFDVSGVIKPPNTSKGKRWLAVRRNNITIAGQTAPGAGITIDGEISLARPDSTDKQPPQPKGPIDNVIIRFLRSRPISDHGNANCTISGSTRTIVDHVSGAWAADQAFNGSWAFKSQSYRTYQWCAIEETDIYLEGGDEPHAFATFVKRYGRTKTVNFSWHHCLLANHMGRCPLYGPDSGEFSNNLIHNSRTTWRNDRLTISAGDIETDTEKRRTINWMGNFYSMGPGGIISAVRAYMPPWPASSVGQVPENGGSYRKVHYFDGDYFAIDGYAGMEKYTGSKVKMLPDKPWPTSNLRTHTAEETRELILAHAGCLPRDAVGKRTIAEARTGTGTWGANVPEGGIMEGLKPGTPPKDTDSDGMPDKWEKKHSLDPNDPKDCSRTVPAGASPGDRHKGYTYIEYYINELADTKIAEALTEYRLNTEPAKPWDKPAEALRPASTPHKTVQEMVKAVQEQSMKKGTRTHAAWFAVQQLSRMGEKAIPAVPELVKQLGNGKDDPRGVAFAAWALGAIGPAAKDAVPDLIKTLRAEHNTKRGKWSYCPYGFIAWAIGRIGLDGEQAKEAVPLLVKMLREKKFTRAPDIAVWILSRVGTSAEPAMPELLRALTGGRQGLFSAEALSNIGKPAVPGLVKILEKSEPEAQANAAHALGLIGERAKPAIPALIKSLQNSNPLVRSSVIPALVDVNPKDQKVLDALVKALDDEHFGVRHKAARALGKAGPSETAVAALKKALSDSRREVKRAAALSLGNIGKAAIPVLTKALSGNDTYVRTYAARAMGNVGKGTVPELISALSDKDAEVRREAVWSLGRLGTEANKAESALKNVLNDDDYMVRYAACEVLKRIDR